jgi:hypothetical protein
MCGSVKEYEIDGTYLIICNDEMNKMLQECRLRERGHLSGACILSIAKGGTVRLSCKLVVPFMGQNCLVVLLRVLLSEMLLEIRVPGAFVIEIIGNSLGDVGLIGAMTFAACLLEDDVAIRKAILTCITCRPSAPFR